MSNSVLKTNLEDLRTQLQNSFADSIKLMKNMSETCNDPAVQRHAIILSSAFNYTSSTLSDPEVLDRYLARELEVADLDFLQDMAGNEGVERVFNYRSMLSHLQGAINGHQDHIVLIRNQSKIPKDKISDDKLRLSCAHTILDKLKDIRKP